MIASSKTLEEMSNLLPQSEKQLQSIKGFGLKKVKKFGTQFLKIVNQYCRENNLISAVIEIEEAPKKKKKVAGDSMKETLQLYYEGKTISQIATIRSMAPTTIESHLALFMKDGRLKVSDFVQPEKMKVIIEKINASESKLLNDIRAQLNSDFSYGEIRMVMAHLEFLEQKNIEVEN
jgi:uncharacterized protein YpbB